MTWLHQIDPVALDIGRWIPFLPVRVHWYGLMYLCAFVAFWMLGTRRARQDRFGWTAQQVSDVLFYGVLGVVLGGRLGYLLFYDLAAVVDDPHRIYQIWKGGMSYHGGLIGLGVAIWLFCRKTHKSTLAAADFIVPCAAIGLFFGRIGNFIGGELFGRLTTAPVGMLFPQAPELIDYQLDWIRTQAPQWSGLSLSQVASEQPGLYADSVSALEEAARSGALDAFARHPSQLYQALMEGLLLFIIVWVFSSKPRPVMSVTGLYFLGYGVFRFIAEFFRQPDSHIGTVAFDWLTMGQMLSLPLMVLGGIMIVLAYRLKLPTTPTAPPSKENRHA